MQDNGDDATQVRVMQLKHTMLVGAVLKWFAAAIQIQTFSSVENAIV